VFLKEEKKLPGFLQVPYKRSLGKDLAIILSQYLVLFFPAIIRINHNRIINKCALKGSGKIFILYDR